MSSPAASPTASTVAGDADDIRDIRGPVELSSGWGLLPWIALGLVLAALAAFLVRRLRRPRAAPPPTPPDVVALEALERARAWMTRAQAERFGTAVSAAVRDYVEARFEVRAPRRTTDEFLRDLAERPVAGLSGHVPALEELLRRMDLVKFAREPLDEPQMDGLLETAVDFVRRTRSGPSAETPR